MIKRFAEWLYYKAFPDRIDEHSMAQMPIPTVEVHRYRPEKILVETRFPLELLNRNEPPIEWIKKDLAAKLVDGLKEYMTIERLDEPRLPNYCVYQAYIRILREEN